MARKKAKKSYEDWKNEKVSWGNEAIQNIRNYARSPEDFKEYLEFMSHFYQYSAHNLAMAKKRFPNPTALATLKQFNEMGFKIRKGEHGVRMLRPVTKEYVEIPYNTKKGESQVRKVYKETKEDLPDWPKAIEKGIQEKKYSVKSERTFEFFTAFDVLQTDAKPEDYPRIFPNRPFYFDFTSEEEAQKLLKAIITYSEDKNIPVHYVNSMELGSAKGASVRIQEKQYIELSNRLTTVESIATMLHELTHAELHSQVNAKEKYGRYSRQEEEFQAELCSYMTCKQFGIDTSEKAIPYIASWTKNLKEVSDKELAQQLNLIKHTSQILTEGVMSHLDVDSLVFKYLQEEKQTIKEKQVQNEVYFNTKHYDVQVPTQELTKISNVLKDGTGRYGVNVTDVRGEEKNIDIIVNLAKGICTAQYYDTETFEINSLDYSNELIKGLIQQKLLPFSDEKEYEAMLDQVQRGIYEYQLDYAFLENLDVQEKERFKKLNMQTNLDGHLETAFISVVDSEDKQLKGKLYSLEEFDQLVSTTYNSDDYIKMMINIHTTPNYYETISLDLGDFADILDYLDEDIVEELAIIEELKENTKKPIKEATKGYESFLVKTTYKERNFEYHIFYNEELGDIKGYYIQDQFEPKQAKASACKNALSYLKDSLPQHMSEEKQHLNYILEKLEDNQRKQELYQKNMQHLNQKYSLIQELSFDEKIEHARTANIIEVAERAGLQLKKDSNNQYRDIQNHSMVFTVDKNYYFENNGQFGGDPINFVQNVLGISDFKEAVQWLNDGNYSTVLSQERLSTEPYQYDDKKEGNTFEHAKHYLVEERKIDEQLVNQLHETGLIKEDRYHKILFLWKDKNRIVGASEQGTQKMKRSWNGRQYWKSIQKGSTSGYGFNVLNGEVKNLKFFESPIDTLSYISLHGLEKDTQYISMDGLKQNIVDRYWQEIYEKTGHIPKIEICVDNDEAGRAFAEKLSNLKFIEKNTKEKLSFIPNLPDVKLGKDWNDVLINQENARKNVQNIAKKQYEVNEYQLIPENGGYRKEYDSNCAICSSYEEAVERFKELSSETTACLALEEAYFDTDEAYLLQQPTSRKVFAEYSVLQNQVITQLQPMSNLTEEKIQNMDPDLLDASVYRYNTDDYIYEAKALKDRIYPNIHLNSSLAQALEEHQLLKICPTELVLVWEKNGKSVGYSTFNEQSKNWIHHGKEPNTFQISFGEPKHLRGFENPSELFSYLALNGWEKDTQYFITQDNESVITHYMNQSKVQDTIIYSENEMDFKDAGVELEVKSTSFQKKLKEKKEQEDQQQRKPLSGFELEL